MRPGFYNQVFVKGTPDIVTEKDKAPSSSSKTAAHLPDTPGKRASRRPLSGTDISQHVFLAKAALAWERLWPLLWLPVALVTSFLILGLFNLPQMLPGWLHSLLLLTYAGALVFLIVRLFRGFAWPSYEDSRRRLEVLNGLPHRPLALLDDDLPKDLSDPGTRLLWDAYQARVRAQLAQLKNHWPRTSWLAQNPWELRGLLATLLVVALVVAGPSAGNRLTQAFQPDFSLTDAGSPRGFNAWITPPAYTGMPPLYLGDQHSTGQQTAAQQSPAEPAGAQGDVGANLPSSIDVPQHSLFLAQVQGGSGLPSLLIDDQPVPFEQEAEGLYRLELSLLEGQKLQVVQDEEILQSWQLNLIPDSPPQIAYLSPPDQAGRGALQVHYLAEDDYGLTELTLTITRQDARGDSLEIPLTLPLPPQNKTVDSRVYQDLSSHLWAGLPVNLVLRGKDEFGQKGQSSSFPMILPERVFTHPVAQALIEQRRNLTLNPLSRVPVSLALDKLRLYPAHYQHDLVVALGLGVAGQRLFLDASDKAIRQVQDLLWYLALHLEQGNVALAEEDLRTLQQELLDALANDAPPEEIDRLMQAVEEALDRFMEALAEQATEEQRPGQEAMMPDIPDDAQILDQSDLKQMLNEARQMAKLGAKDQARRMLEQLQELLENMQARKKSTPATPQTKEARELMQRMDELRRKQQNLLDRNFQQRQQDKGLGRQKQFKPTQKGENGKKGNEERQSSNSGDARAQEQLRKELGDIMRRFGDLSGQVPRELGKAEQAMRAARDALQQGTPQMALNPQTEAVDQLQQGLEVMMDSMLQERAKGTGDEGGMAGDQSGDGEDPLGRGGGNRVNPGEKMIPTEFDLPKARAILQELQRRRGEQDRPTLELDYLDRLLDRF
ncbi:TIGR02302 family protein [Rhodovibrionaceae bacterium A322]